MSNYDGRIYCSRCGLDYPCGDPEHAGFMFINDDPDDEGIEP